MRLVGRAFLCLAGAAALYVASSAVFLPPVAAYRWLDPGTTALMRLRVEQGFPAALPRPWTPLGKIASSLLNAVLVAEDDRFLEHAGFDVERLREAAERDLQEHSFARGASTISQQLVKNLFLNPARNPLRKLKEAALTLALEVAVPKSRILEIYVNIIEWGPGIYGIGAASDAYFGRRPARLTRAQSALLAASIPNPLQHNPKLSTPWLRSRQGLVLRRIGSWNRIPPDWTR